MKRILAIAIAAAVALCMLAACGSNGGQTAQPSATETAAENTTVPEEQDEEARAFSQEMLENISEAFDGILAQNYYEGAAYAVLNGQEIYASGAGKADEDKGINNSPDVVYHAASITKQFTAAAVLRLCEEGKLSLDDTLGKFYPEYEKGRDITLHNLLSMQSGITDPARYDEEGNEISSSEYNTAILAVISPDNSAQENLDALKKAVFDMDLLFEQGERFSYSNTNYTLLAGIIEQASGMGYHEYIKTNFFDPLGMDTAGFIDDYDIDGVTVAEGYNRGEDYVLLSYPGIEYGAGDLMASPKDLYKWTAALHGGRILSDGMYQKMITAYAGDVHNSNGYGYGLQIGETKYGSVTYFHGGNLPCFKSAAIYAPEEDLFIALMSNYNCENSTTVAAMMAAYLHENLG